MADTLRRDVERAVERLNEKAERLGMDRRFELEAGNHNQGRQHKLLEHHPATNHPIALRSIGPTYHAAYQHLIGVEHGLDVVLGDRKLRHDAIANGAPGGDPFRTGRTEAATFVDPDARSVTRRLEDNIG